MKIIRDLRKLPLKDGPLVITIGNFDGIHLGHQSLIREVLAESSKGYLKGLITFRPHPQKVLRGASVNEIYSDREMISVLELLGMDYLILKKFDKNFSQMSAEDFFYKWFLKRVAPSKVVLGFNFRFGHKGKGDVSLFEKMCKGEGIELKVVDPVFCNEEVVSSSKIRSLLSEGEIEQANKMLGKNYFYVGKVTHGKKIGKDLGAPTANINLSRKIPLRNGVYMTKVWVEREAFLAVTNVGLAPTLKGEGPTCIESHLLDQQMNLYGKEISVEFLKFLRPEKKFESLIDLKSQIQKDICRVRKPKV